MATPEADAQKAKAFIEGMMNHFRQSYGANMDRLGVDPAIIVAVQLLTATDMVKWITEYPEK